MEARVLGVKAGAFAQPSSENPMQIARTRRNPNSFPANLPKIAENRSRAFDSLLQSG
jgi:hypothetical protein